MSETVSHCPLATRCRTHGYYHGAEAEELREGIEAAIQAAVGLGKKSVPVSSLRTLLDETDARDSLAYLEVKDRESSDE